MSKNEIDVTLRLGVQYLNPKYNDKQPGGHEGQTDKEEGVFAQAIAALAEKDQDVLKIWKIVKKNKKRG
jgi:hypothetical protein